MKKMHFALLLLAITFTTAALSQPLTLPLPVSTLIPHYRLTVSYASTTVLIFPAAVKAVDRGARDVLAQQQPGVDNVLKLKAAHRGFAPTNLHVFTADGRVFAFDLFYNDSLATTRILPIPAFPGEIPGAGIRLSDEPINTDRLNGYLAAIRQQSPTCRTHTSEYHMGLRLDNIDMGGPYLFLRLTVTNHSTLDYTPDFLRLYICDQSRARRTSRQDQEITPAYADTLPTIHGNASRSIVLAIPRLTIPNHREFQLELYERSGGRSLTLRLRNRQLFRARPLVLPPIPTHAQQ